MSRGALTDMCGVFQLVQRCHCMKSNCSQGKGWSGRPLCQSIKMGISRCRQHTHHYHVCTIKRGWSRPNQTRTDPDWRLAESRGSGFGVKVISISLGILVCATQTQNNLCKKGRRMRKLAIEIQRRVTMIQVSWITCCSESLPYSFEFLLWKDGWEYVGWLWVRISMLGMPSQ